MTASYCQSLILASIKKKKKWLLRTGPQCPGQVSCLRTGEIPFPPSRLWTRPISWSHVCVICMRPCLDVLHAWLSTLLFYEMPKHWGPKGVPFACCTVLIICCSSGAHDIGKLHTHAHPGRDSLFCVWCLELLQLFWIKEQSVQRLASHWCCRTTYWTKGALGFLSCGIKNK